MGEKKVKKGTKSSQVCGRRNWTNALGVVWFFFFRGVDGREGEENGVES